MWRKSGQREGKERNRTERTHGDRKDNKSKGQIMRRKEDREGKGEEKKQDRKTTQRGER